MKSGLNIGDLTDSGNFQLVKKIETLDELYFTLETDASIFCRHKMYPCAFILSWQIRLCKSWLRQGYFWTTLKIN